MGDEDVKFDIARPQIRNGITVGATVYVLGILISHLLLIPRILLGSGDFGNFLPPVYIGFRSFYDSHQFAFPFYIPVNPIGFILDWIVFLLPMILLVGAGYLVYRRGDTENRTPETAILTGSLIFLGYVPLALIGAISLYWTSLIRLLITVIMTGVFPIVFGGLGSYMSYKYN